MKKISFLAGVAALALAFSSAQAEETLRIGVEGAYPPFSFKAEDGTLGGFDIEIAMALCAEMKRSCELVEQDWDGIIPALVAKKYDAIVASMSITEERKKTVDFTNKYYNTPALFVAAKDATFADTNEGMKGKTVGVQRGTTHQCYMEKHFPDVELKTYGTQDEVYLDMNSGRIDAFIADSIAANDGFLATDDGKDFKFLGGVQYDAPCHGEGAGIAIRKNSDDLREAFNNAIKAIRENGTYKAINDKYFDFDVYGS